MLYYCTIFWHDTIDPAECGKSRTISLLFGNDFLSDETNCEIFLIIQRYIKDTERKSIIVTK